MRNSIILLAVTMLASAPAFASRARLESLGEGKNGSFYIKDNRNVFLNPATIIDQKKQFNLELGSASSATVDSSGAPQAQANYIGSFGDFNYNLAFGNQSDAAITALSAFVGGLAPLKYTEFGLAGDAGVKWGVSAFHGGNYTSTTTGTTSATHVGARFGLGMDAFNFFGTVGIIANSKSGADNVAKGNIALNLTATYAMDDFTFFGNFVNGGVTYYTGSPATEVGKVSNMDFSVGVGHQKEMVKGVSMFSKAAVNYGTTSTTPTGGTEAKTKTWSLPVTLGVEAEALNWLVLRGSASHGLFGKGVVGTAVTAGTGLKFGAVTIDSLVTQNGVNGAGEFGLGQEMLYRLSMNVAL